MATEGIVAPTARAPRDPGTAQLARIGWIQAGLLVLGACAWLLRSPRAALAYGLAGLGSMAFWHLHRWIVGRMLTPSVRMRWAFGILVVVKLALLALMLHGMMECFPLEVIPSVTGILLFSAAILLEAATLLVRSEAE